MITFIRGCSSNGRALALQARGTGIDALLLHILNERTIYFGLNEIPQPQLVILSLLMSNLNLLSNIPFP